MIAIIVMTAALVGAWIGWRRGNAALYRRSSDEVLGYRSIQDGVLKRRRVSRMVQMIVRSLVGGVLGLLVLMVLARPWAPQRRRDGTVTLASRPAQQMWA